MKYENPGSATPVVADAGVFVLSTSRLTSRIRQKNIGNEREYRAGTFLLSRVPRYSLKSFLVPPW